MSVFDKHRDTLEHHETMMGPARGRLAVALDLLTDSLALVGQHGVYCRSERFPGKPKMDIALVLEQLDDAKQLVQSAMEDAQERSVELNVKLSKSELLRLRRLAAATLLGVERCRLLPARLNRSATARPGTQNITPSAKAAAAATSRRDRAGGRSSSSTPTTAA